MKRFRLIFAAVVLSVVAACSSDVMGPDAPTTVARSTGALGSGH